MDMLRAESTFAYEYKKDTKFGSLLVGQNQIPIYVIEDCTPNLQSCIQISHANQVSYKMYDKDNNRMICETWDTTLRNYLSAKKMIDSFNSFLYLDPSVRKAFREILTYVNNMNDSNFVLDDFTLENLVVKNEVVKFINVGLQKTTNPIRKKNLISVKNIFLGLLPLNRKSLSLPRDYINFMNKFDSLVNIGKFEANSLLFHVCLMSPRSVLKFLENIGATQRNPKMNTELSVMTPKLGDFSHWNKKLLQLGLEDLRKCFDEDIKNSLKVDPNNPNKKPKPKYVFEKSPGQTTYFWELNHSLFRCCRNLVVHAIVQLNKKEIIADVGGEIGVIKRQVLILNTFMDEVCLLQQQLCLNKYASLWFE